MIQGFEHLRDCCERFFYSLSFQNCKFVGKPEATIVNVIQKLRGLSTLELTNSGISEKGLKTILESLPKVEFVVVSQEGLRYESDFDDFPNLLLM